MEDNNLFRLYLNFWIYLASVTFGTIAAIYDLKLRRIPNWLTFGGMLIGVILNLILNPSEWYWPLVGLFSGLLLLFIPFALAGLGAGDLKLVMALGAFLGPYAIIWTVLLGGIYGGLLSLVVVFKKLGSRAWFRIYLAITSLWDAENRRLLRDSFQTTPKIYIPYGVAIYLGLLSLLLLRPWC